MENNLEDISFENLVLFYKVELLETYKTGSFSNKMSEYIRKNLRKYGVLVVEKGQKIDHVYLTEKTINTLKKYQLI